MTSAIGQSSPPSPASRPLCPRPAISRAYSFRTLLDDLRPYDGRLEMALHIAVLCGLTAVIAMSLRIPEALLACYLILLMYRDNAGEGILIGLGLIIAATLVVVLMVFLLMLVSDNPLLRLVLMGAITFAGMWVSRATILGEPAGLITFVIVFILSMVDYASVPELLVRGLVWAWIMTFVPMALLVALNIFIGRSPLRLVRRRLHDRLAAAVALAEGGGAMDGSRLLSEGNERMLTHAKMARLLGEVSKEEHARLEAQITASFDLVAAVQANAVAAEEDFSRFLPVLQQLAQNATLSLPGGDGPLAQAVQEMAVANLPSADHVAASKKSANKRPSLLVPDAFTNAAYVRFALKVLLAVFLTYVFYTSIGLFEIHTAMITCFIVALGTSGETFQKSSLRIIGCLIGAAMGTFAVTMVVPHLSDPGHLFLLVATGSLIAGWVALGSYRTQYAGLQIGLAFFICVLPGSIFNVGPNYDLSDAAYRILGILIGISVMWLVFANMWPERAATSQAEETDRALRAMAAFLRDEGGLEPVHQALAVARRDAEMAAFDGLGGPRDPEQDLREERLCAAEVLSWLMPLLKVSEDAPALAAACEQAGVGSTVVAAHRQVSTSSLPGDRTTTFAWSLMERLIQSQRA